MSKIIGTGGPAFPGNYSYVDGYPSNYEGMTLRDWFAGQMLPKIGMGWPNLENRELIAKQAYEMADAMLAEKFKADEINMQARKEEMDDDRPF